VGTNFGRRLDPFLPRGYLQARYSYAFVERIVGISANRSNAEFQLGYFLTSRLSLLANAALLYTHRGVEWIYRVPQIGLTHDQWPHHDQISKTRLFNAGAGAAYAVKPSLQLFIFVARSVSGRNAHLHAAVATVGASKTFRTKRERETAFAVETAMAPEKTFVCACAKK